MAVIRLWLVLLAVEAVFFLALRLYLRLRRAERLRDRWRDRHGHGAAGEDTYVARGMAGFERGLRARLSLLVFVLPNLAVLVTVYLVNWH
ncbi:hypothetical protein Q4511_14705 [Paracoccus sp. 1_MG-2023]|uniref:hypothetical protein n=1 Tax=unclassified Paracoccus (in: a-proteobacteria) TaxID=2688777 RepID=UPI001C0A07F4|nr:MULTISPECIES: hypothetical protein [unclassified Paracoccus (in: a-proteobacteria)]MBU2957502.1 hypothetical protein [Paracoccus sp. C2R09]MDO6670176.1 hypothetical protein [Paracoccus sp. 1_MG-2023]